MSLGRPSRRAAVVAAVAAGVLLAGTTSPVATLEADPPACERVVVPVALAPGRPQNTSVVGWLCGPRPDGGTVHVLLSGFTYGHVYWDLPYQPGQYSYVRAMNAAGYATFNIDRIGVGESDKPPALDVTIQSNAYVAHQIIQHLRRGDIGAVAFSRVVLVGHSMGSAMSVVEAAQFGDVDGVILTGYLHDPAGNRVSTALLHTVPAQNEARFADRPLGYLTTSPGSRDDMFYFSPATDPKVVAVDEATKETGSAAELATYHSSFAYSPAIRVPVLVLIGDEDGVICAPLCALAAALEPLYYSPEADVEVVLVRGHGHNLNLEKNASDSFSVMREWSDRRVGHS